MNELIIKEKTILEAAAALLSRISDAHVRAASSMHQLGPVGLIAYGKLLAANLFYDGKGLYMLTFIENYTNELNEIIEKNEAEAGPGN